jgi:hypothetical protein
MYFFKNETLTHSLTGIDHDALQYATLFARDATIVTKTRTSGHVKADMPARYTRLSRQKSCGAPFSGERKKNNTV